MSKAIMKTGRHYGKFLLLSWILRPLRYLSKKVETASLSITLPLLYVLLVFLQFRT
jgi:hypothetical protein